MDAEGRYCRGCARTLDEIARWGIMSEEEQAAVIAQLPARQGRQVQPPAPRRI